MMYSETNGFFSWGIKESVGYGKKLNFYALIFLYKLLFNLPKHENVVNL